MNESKTNSAIPLSHSALTMKVYKSRSNDLVSYFSSLLSVSSLCLSPSFFLPVNKSMTDPVQFHQKVLQLQFHPISRSVNERANSSLTSDRILERIQLSVRNLIKTIRLQMQFEHGRCDERRGSFHVSRSTSYQFVILIYVTVIILTPPSSSFLPLSIHICIYVCIYKNFFKLPTDIFISYLMSGIYNMHISPCTLFMDLCVNFSLRENSVF